MGIEFIRFRCRYKSREDDKGKFANDRRESSGVINSLKRLKFFLLFSFRSS